jgi:hypothetical protein
LWRNYTHSFPETICRRHSDGTLWIASSNGIGHAMIALVGRGNKFFFRRIHRFAGGWISDFGNTWEFSDGSLFDVISKKEHKILVKRKQWREFIVAL